MTIQFQVLGQPGRDNAVFLTLDSGQSISRLLFDCGAGCPEMIAFNDLQAIDGLFISHFHMDHVSGFDSVLRCNFNRSEQPLVVVGPQDTCRVLTHRLRGFTWNLVSDAEGSVEVREYQNESLRKIRMATGSQFEVVDFDETTSSDGVVMQSKNFSVSMIELDHGCVSAGYVVREPGRQNIDTAKMTEMNLQPGAWLQKIKDTALPDHELILVGDRSRNIGELRTQLLVESPGSSFAYLTDFRATDGALDELVEFIRDVNVVVCENNYRDEELELAKKHHHLTSSEVGEIARTANVDRLVLFHLSDRYLLEDWQQQLDQVRQVFPNSHWPDSWTELLPENSS